MTTGRPDIPEPPYRRFRPLAEVRHTDLFLLTLLGGECALHTAQLRPSPNKNPSRNPFRAYLVIACIPLLGFGLRSRTYV